MIQYVFLEDGLGNMDKKHLTLSDVYEAKEYARVHSEPMMSDIRCKKCNRLLMKGTLLKIEIKCPKCGLIQKIEEKNK
jgi:predicted Zn-ribbon and HTH transcriptional regulator